MARPRNSQPTDGELEILKHLWNAGPCALGHICSLLRQERSVATTTVATMLTVMLAKGLVTRSRGSRGYLWSAKSGRAATTGKLVDRFVERAFDGSVHLLVAHLVESKKLTTKERRQVLELLEKGAAATRKPGSALADPQR
ncbi:MAG: BlaI/MecI/CopY family transcriptional regulator [Planctomycetia bacterium]|nr:BlaI/MecI/CopY family transcriptional regulator [Planctomycetia bacterium]